MADSLRTVIGTTLVIGAALTGVLLLRESRYAPDWLRTPSTEPSASAPALPPPQPPAPAVDVPPPPPTTTASSEAVPSSTASVAAATPEPTASAAQPVASASAGKGRKQGAPAAAQPGEPEVVELPNDYRYAPQGAGNLTFPVAPATASTGTGR